MTHPPRWTQPEIEHLERFAGDVPFPTLLRSMRYQAVTEGWPRRTDKAISQRLRRTGQYSRARVGEWTTPNGAGEILGCPGTRYINRRSWRRLARVMPRVLGGFSLDALFALLDDRDFADAIVAAHRIEGS